MLCKGAGTKLTFPHNIVGADVQSEAGSISPVSPSQSFPLASGPTREGGGRAGRILYVSVLPSWLQYDRKTSWSWAAHFHSYLASLASGFFLLRAQPC